MAVDKARIEGLIRDLLVAIGEDPDREGLQRTPRRVAEAWEFLSSGYRTDRQRLLNDAIFTQETNSMVIVKNIEVYSLCEHHLLPFYGRCHIGYIPTGKVFGVSQARTARRHVFAPPAAAGAADRADLAGHHGADRRARAWA